jgi:hypothetical protein
VDRLRIRERRGDGPVFSDESIELFLSPSETGEPYYQFAVNAAGVRFERVETAYGVRIVEQMFHIEHYRRETLSTQGAGPK